jgi:proteasome lid subunit RPN8/RPN11
MPISLAENHAASIRAHGEATYPNECCGFLVGSATGDSVGVHDVIPASNDFADGSPVESQRNRYVIDPDELYRVEMQARERKLGVVGVYHSHPDAPARPSEYDRERACPWYCYLIVSVQSGKSEDIRNWMLADDGSGFVEDSIIIRGDQH